MTLREALTRAASQLAAHPTLRESALPDATLLLLHTLQIDRATLLAHPDRGFPRDQQIAYQALLERRLRFEPIQYITGTQEFYGLALHVNPAVLIPRAETELLVESVLKLLPHDQPLRIADVGTGSGAIAIAIAVHLPLAGITAIDNSPAALEVARHNAETHQVTSRIEFLQSDLLTTFSPHQPFDAILSNPPYVPSSDRTTLHPQVREHEPAQALFAGEDGLDIYRRLIPQAHALLKPGGLLALEFGFGQAGDLEHLLTGWDILSFLSDLQHIPRVVLARSI